MLHTRTLWYHDENGRLQMVVIESTNPSELEKFAGIYAAIERVSRQQSAAWRGRHRTFADLPVKADPDMFTTAVGVKEHSNGFPWEGPYFKFSICLGEGFPWSGPESLWVTEDEGRSWKCRCCGHLARLPLTACCLNADCSRTGLDMVIPRPTTNDLKKREEPKPAPTKLPPPLRDRMGKTLAGGLRGKR